MKALSETSSMGLWVKFRVAAGLVAFPSLFLMQKNRARQLVAGEKLLPLAPSDNELSCR